MSTNFPDNPRSCQVTERTRNSIANDQREITPTRIYVYETLCPQQMWSGGGWGGGGGGGGVRVDLNEEFGGGGVGLVGASG